MSWVYHKPFSDTVFFILRGEINAYQKQIKVISITSEMIYQSLGIDIIQLLTSTR